MVVIKEPISFQWDRGNIGKNEKSHEVTEKEAEETFFDKKKVIYKDKFHSEKEDRFILIGKTREKRLLYLVFTKRGTKMRIISARDINRKEVKYYVEKT
ncbi:MAG: hypothetical protein UR39_C0004G0028 [Candidatus Woesebacteria bacterium GW2011_GWA1_33_30]|uniref:Protein containing DUF497 n=1 Tax=Candidatus Woesebacteria bacterium GW2011_GWA2_33_28 TaxID=1618561 RepID=A0A0G0CVW4_9BACT|nr:MAG: hypothetical protein UR38_C0004G0045 [Candidatus Woesebacteria bacterium GW2011_GWA2_33_28]KKP48407.1 MAG: hypothetical protein UR39_C0004G0028 [Candidatus Woesebacteria bacterium GW2011_GWA1_33_30]KKP49514.1 MAG: hypothetical protein UR40_C0005G0028 [Microgenomates group bacterium GW2011_GWC1_33_32]KKP52479.1 MAG: hypothetical protein UR44_C0002G0028 [Candidatus Woesebacteria bacterium GW2011_GWB1_33_38]KKP58337.1 MAG: hypothetical protein UR48_C0005G0015 [Microgenomates group bacteriu